MNNTVIKIINLSKGYKLYDSPMMRFKEAMSPFKKKYHKDFFAIKNLSFEIKKGEIVGIIGRNGSGKSTLLKMVTGVLTPSSGSVEVNGKVSAILELGAGFNSELTGIENLELNLNINGESKKNISKKIKEITDFAELGEYINQPTKTYSSGMKARLSFGLAIHIEPDIFIVDEALSVGDAAFQRKCFARMEAIRISGATILFVSHSEGSIVSLCDRAIWLHHGEKILDGKPKFVTALYLKHSGKNQISIQDIQTEYKAIAMSSTNESDEKAHIKYNDKQEISKKEYYDPKLVSKSTVTYEEKGAKISDVKVTTLDGQKVNVLVHGREYVYSYKTSITSDLKQVQYGFLLKTINGVDIGGGTFPDRNTFVEKKSGEYEIKWYFKAFMNNGDYFFNAGLLELKENTREYCHRIVDAYMIKVIDSEQQITGTVKIFNNIIETQL